MVTLKNFFTKCIERTPTCYDTILFPATSHSGIPVVLTQYELFLEYKRLSQRRIFSFELVIHVQRKQYEGNRQQKIRVISSVFFFRNFLVSMVQRETLILKLSFPLA